MDGSLDLRTRRNIARNVSELDLLDLQKQGQELYGQKKFEEALKCFDQAILSDATPPTSILDNRAATYMRLGRLKPALRDGKRMIEQDKCKCSGYLRTGQILQRMGNLGTALDIYQLGLRKVNPSDAQREALRKLYGSLTKRCSPPNAVDPMQILPIEIVELIISYLDFRQTVTLLRVSKSWKSLLSSMPRLWTDLDWSTTKKSPSLTTIRQYVKYAQNSCRALRFRNYLEYKHNILNYVASRCQDLQELRFSTGILGISCAKAAHRAKNLKTLIISSQVGIYPDTVIQLLNNCANLERAEIHSMSTQISSVSLNNFNVPRLPNLHTLVLNVARQGNVKLRAAQLLESVRNIHSLTLQHWNFTDLPCLDFSCLHDLEYLDISGVEASWPPNLPISIRSLITTGCIPQADVLSPSEPPILPNLSHLQIGGISPFYNNFYIMKMVKASTAKLQSLDISGLMSMSEADILSLISGGSLARIEMLSLKELDVNDAIADHIASSLPQLRSLDLARTQVTGVGVKALLSRLSDKLQWLGLDECTHTSPDAVELARSMGVNVSYKFPDLAGGRKVRSHY